MSYLTAQFEDVRAKNVEVSEDGLIIDMVDGRKIITPLSWYPWLWYGNPEERDNFGIIGNGALIHWPDLNEYISVSGVLAGYRSGVSQEPVKSLVVNLKV